MITKTLIAAAAVSAIAFGASAPANAKVNVDLYLGGFAPGYYEPAYPVYGGYDEEYEPPRRRHHSYGISCEDGRDAVRSSGFRKVRAVSCSGNRYTYKARRHGDTFIVKVSRRSGDVISVQETY